MVRLLLVGLRVYQVYLSPLIFSACKFYPSCSHYAYQAIELHGPRRGAWLALKRLLRCRPFAAGGCDPVPELDVSEPGVPEPEPFIAIPSLGRAGTRNPSEGSFLSAGTTGQNEGPAGVDL